MEDPYASGTGEHCDEAFCHSKNRVVFRKCSKDHLSKCVRKHVTRGNLHSFGLSVPSVPLSEQGFSLLWGYLAYFLYD